ncbi:HpcH/HpaI aldolase/citrate lyase family protein [Paenarthrobacter sp. Z7-10]|uniref:HpcH/HpaI aldolase/citrate lyase family protein n=1 Tax=Paenarthrobacter sp. Z7-10 TaxID=2787635 RepID=UPI0022A9E694|nr:HpcH/HpaI aldolase/citrate lyase family protein [Paenarthrobacter sp. Z7-10]MCZ2401902.1 HpcH/HpaI aldolase/citrate lyase family protein [Paenarthrobacter sp. Z7-10]
MRHFAFLSEEQTSRLFHIRPRTLSPESDPALLATALGATLYCPADRPQLAADIRKQALRGCMSMVLCLEDSIADSAVDDAETNVVQTLSQLHRRMLTAASDSTPDSAQTPLLFIRVRTPEQMVRLAQRCGESLNVLAGFVAPKFENESGIAQQYMDALHRIHNEHGQGRTSSRRRLRLMPILESPVMIHAETRSAALANIRRVLQANREDILAVRLGATDMCSAFGLRRTRDLTVYDVSVVASMIGDIVNLLGRPEDGFVISGPVWEHYANTERLLRPLLRATPFAAAEDVELRQRLLLGNLDSLMREIALDQANGLLGKTVIHPSHVPLVHAMSVISHEEYLDAGEILGQGDGGAKASPYRNKMNEMKPHQGWAAATARRAAVFGVAAENITYVDLLEAGMS